MINSFKTLFRLELDPNRIFGLDILRAFAILFVVIGHGNYLLPIKFEKFFQLFIFDGVFIFFGLSGFLIGGILIKIVDQNKYDTSVLINFWVRRWFRTLPNYFLILLLLCILNYLFTDNFTFWSVKKYFIFSQNLFYEHPNWFLEAWSLSIEEWFYIVTPILIFIFIHVFKINPKKAVLFTALAVIFSVTLFRYYRYTVVQIKDIHDWAFLIRSQVITRLDSLMFGVLGAYFSYYNSNWLKYKKSLLIIGLILMFVSKYIIKELTDVGGLYNTVFSFTTFSIASLFLLPYLSDYKKGSGVLYKCITYISLISYSMYLLNLSVIQHWIINRIPWTYLLNNSILILISKYGLYWFLVISLSIVLYKYFEIPMTRLRDYRKKN
jgi:peptidoglycan/LPS O-acetylase OafA/YrhL